MRNVQGSWVHSSGQKRSNATQIRKSVGGAETDLPTFKMGTTYLMLNFCRFRNCLKMVNSANADMVGRFFFNYIRIPCFIIKRKTECARWTWWGKCIKQETKETATIQQVPRYN